MTGRCFVDANVLVYARDPRDKAKQVRAILWLERLWTEQRGCTSMQVLSEYYVVVTRKLKPGVPGSEAWEDVRSFLAWSPQPVDAALIRQARKVEEQFGLSWWDSMVVAAAQLQECDTLLTEDLQDGADYGGVAARNPFLHVIEQPAASYRTPHRGRGRPRKLVAASA
jgi:predicted nucleic acid-binding protein